MELGAMVIGALALLVSTAVQAYRQVAYRSRVAAWHRAARAAQLEDVRADKNFTPWLKGKAGILSVELRPYTTASESGTAVVIAGLRHWPDSLSLRSEQEIGLLERAHHKELVIGDPALDDVAFVQGAPDLVHALLDVETRRVLSELFRGRPRRAHVVLADQELRARIPEDRRAEGAEHPVVKLLPLLVAAAKRLLRPSDLAGRLAHNALKDPLPAVRLANLQLLIVRHQTELVKETLRAALDDPDEEVRLTAGASLDEAGWPALLKVALKTVNDSRGARAVVLLGDALPWPEARQLFQRARRLGLTCMALRCLEAFGRTRRKESLELLHEIISSDSSGRALAAARAIAAIADPSSEAPLVAVLAMESPPLVAAAAEGLGKLGSVSVVSALHEASDRHPHDPEVRRAVRQAVAEIHSRLRGASPGQLSLTTIEAGQVSLAEDEAKRGLVSLEDRDGRE